MNEPHLPEEMIVIRFDMARYREGRKLALLGIQMMDDEVDKAVVRGGYEAKDKREGPKERRINGLPQEH